jgi:hypothetical protein
VAEREREREKERKQEQTKFKGTHPSTVSMSPNCAFGEPKDAWMYAMAPLRIS